MIMNDNFKCFAFAIVRASRRVVEVAHFFLSSFKAVITDLHPG